MIAQPAWLTELWSYVPTGDTAIKYAVLLVGLYLLLRFYRFLRSRRAPKIHPKLAPYMMNDPSVVAQRRADAAGIIATSSTDRVAGYEIVRQIEAVYEDGHRSPADAVEALKATAAKKGANAIINLSQERTAAGRSTATGDAVVIKPILPTQPPSANPTPPARLKPEAGPPPVIAQPPPTTPKSGTVFDDL